MDSSSHCPYESLFVSRQDWHCHPINTAVGLLSTTFRNLISRMGKTSNLSREKKASVIALQQAGYSTREIGRCLLCSQNSVSYTMCRYDETGNNDDRRRSGRPRASTPRDDQYLCRIARRHLFMTARIIQAEWEPVLPERVSMQTVCKD